MTVTDEQLDRLARHFAHVTERQWPTLRQDLRTAAETEAKRFAAALDILRPRGPAGSCIYATRGGCYGYILAPGEHGREPVCQGHLAVHVAFDVQVRPPRAPDVSLAPEAVEPPRPRTAEDAREPHDEGSEDETPRLRASLSEAHAAVVAARLDALAERDSARQECERLREELAEAQREASGLQQLHASASSSCDALLRQRDEARAELARLREQTDEAERVREQLRAGLRRGMAAREAGPVWTEATREAVRAESSQWWDQSNPDLPFATLAVWQQERLLRAGGAIVAAYFAALARGAAGEGEP